MPIGSAGRFATVWRIDSGIGVPVATQSICNDFCLPDLGEGLGDAELIEWCVKIGQQVQENDILAKMETAKALVEVPSPRAGVVAVLHGKPGDTIKVGSPLVTFKSGSSEPSVSEVPPARESRESEPQRPADAGSVVGSLATSYEDDSSHHARATPAVRRRARELGVDIERITGSGIGGRVMLQDVEASADDAPRRPTAPLAPSAPTALNESEPERIPFRGVRRAIAEHLRYSVSHAVHFTVMDEADVTALDELRRRLVLASNEKITLLPFVAAAVCRVMAGGCGAQFRRLNSTVDDDRQEIVQHRVIHLGIATDTEVGLMVPVIRNAGAMGVLEISRQIAELAKAARDRSIPPHRLTGSTFTISNFGALGGRFGTPIINYPEAGILAVGRAHEGVIVRQGMLGVGKLLPLSLSADHRVIDGATASTALAKIIDLLQSPNVLLPPG
jgi:pyruvate dehydrogenase E2 component (dihydrolipoamide acetyltransferase)